MLSLTEYVFMQKIKNNKHLKQEKIIKKKEKNIENYITKNRKDKKNYRKILEKNRFKLSGK